MYGPNEGRTPAKGQARTLVNTYVDFKLSGWAGPRGMVVVEDDATVAEALAVGLAAGLRSESHAECARELWQTLALALGTPDLPMPADEAAAREALRHLPEEPRGGPPFRLIRPDNSEVIAGPGTRISEAAGAAELRRNGEPHRGLAVTVGVYPYANVG